MATLHPTRPAFNPLAWIRDGVRAFTVLQMKDRAGKVGANGVALMLRALADDTEARIHLVGHSYGAKLLMSALCIGAAPSRDVDSVLLLQPAFSCYGFTDDLEGRPGGYRTAIDRVRQPIIATRSDHDTPLRRLFHLAVRRSSDLAEAQIAGEPPSKFAALGGYGPQWVPGGAEWIDLPDVGDPYPATTKRIYGVNGTAYISSHGAVETRQTAWALADPGDGLSRGDADPIGPRPPDAEDPGRSAGCARRLRDRLPGRARTPDARRGRAVPRERSRTTRSHRCPRRDAIDRDPR